MMHSPRAVASLALAVATSVGAAQERPTPVPTPPAAVVGDSVDGGRVSLTQRWMLLLRLRGDGQAFNCTATLDSAASWASEVDELVSLGAHAESRALGERCALRVRINREGGEPMLVALVDGREQRMSWPSLTVRQLARAVMSFSREAIAERDTPRVWRNDTLWVGGAPPPDPPTPAGQRARGAGIPTGDFVMMGGVGTLERGVQVGMVAPTQVALRVVADGREETCGAPTDRMVAWADSAEAFLAGITVGGRSVAAGSVTERLSPTISAACGMRLTFGTPDGARRYTVRFRDVAAGGMEVAVSRGGALALLRDVRETALRMDSIIASVGMRVGDSNIRRTLDTMPGRPQGPDDLWFEFQVDTPATMLRGSPTPRVPAALRAQRGLRGEALVQFHVDTLGRFEPGSFRVLRATHPEWVRAVEEAIPAMRFSPATKDGKRVRQLVQQPFEFEIGR